MLIALLVCYRSTCTRLSVRYLKLLLVWWPIAGFRIAEGLTPAVWTAVRRSSDPRSPTSVTKTEDEILMDSDGYCDNFWFSTV